MKSRTFTACSSALLLMLAATPLARAQIASPTQRYNIGNAVRQGEESQKAPVPGATAVPVLPQPAEPPFTLQDNATLLVHSLEVDDPNPVDDAEVRAILAPYENRQLKLAEIYEAADKITTLYRTRGYLVAKAYVPAQDASGGLLKIKLVLGKYGSVTIDNKSLVNDDYLHNVTDHAIAGSPFVRSDDIERAMLLVSDLPGSAMPRVVIGPGQQQETSDFVFDVPEGRLIDGYVLGDNYGSPFTGRDRVSAGLDLNSPFGYGDRLSVFGVTSDRTDLVNGRIGYSLPIGYDGLRAEIAAYRTTYTLGGIYQPLSATGTADAIAGTLTYPLVRQRDDSLYLSGNFTHKALVDKVLGISLADRTIDLGTAGITGNTAGAVVGWPLATSTTFSLTQGYVEFSNAAQKSTNIAGPDTVGNYTKLDLTFNATLAFTEKLSLAANLRAQRSLSGNLDSSEQLGLTGYWGVRSYDEGLSGDSGYIMTPELKYALPDVFDYHHSIGLFTDWGGASLANAAFTTTQKSYTQLSDVGAGYYATLEYSTNRFLLLTAEVAHSYGSVNGAQSYNRGTKALMQVGFTF